MRCTRLSIRTLAGLFLSVILLQPLAHADEVKAAVAANFTAAIKQLTPLFEQKTGHKLVASFGATGQLYAQINNGAPFDVFLAADDQAPQQLIASGNAVAGSHFIYARGRLALWSSTPGYVDSNGDILKSNKFEKIAVANPKIAPYGKAAIETLTALKLLEQLQPKFVTGENIAQTQQFISTGNVPLGFIALAQVNALPATERGSFWVVPDKLHEPIEQGAVLLKNANADASAATAFLAFLKSPEAVTVIRELGYEVP
ncbi:MAG: molybdenum transporter periplasmic molybdate-binding protein [Verrucomicrobiaceae bacterium]|nr:molybdenum transporter periplasmic molybdate-binding protein [Verrucomicrobiaceae bacterium]